MKLLTIAVFFLFSTMTSAQTSKDKLVIIPLPVSVIVGSGNFVLTKKTVLAASDEADKHTAHYFNKYLQQVYGFKLKVDKQSATNYIRFSTKKFVQTPDKNAYRLIVNKDGVTIHGDSYASTFYGVQTLIQLLPVASNLKPQTSNFLIPFVTINDYPRFAYRGMHLDVSRHFSPVSFVKKYIDYLALHKLNYFHWHLTDDQGWRIEIKKYPALMSAAAYRNGTIIGRYPGTGNDNIRYGGYYTQQEVKDVVAYAAERHIIIIPEIEMPGHASAAIAAYPWLSCFPKKDTKIPSHPSQKSKTTNGKKVQETWGVFEDIFCGGKDSTFLFLQDVLDEVLPLFPSPYIHVGGDEAPKTHWKACPQCQARIKAEGLKDEHGLQSYFIQRIEKHLNSKGRTLIGWDEILEGGLAPNAVVMSWRGEKGGVEAAKQKHKVIMTPEKPVYFDHTQSKNEDSVVIGGYNPLEAVYSYEPVSTELSVDEARYILGAQANLWTEYIKNPAKVEYMIFPRMSALSEVLWSPKERKNWKDFEQRLQTQFKRYDSWKVNHSKAYYDIQVKILPSDKDGLLKVELSTNSKEGIIRYVPSRFSAALVLYETPIFISASNPYLQVVSYKTQYNSDVKMETAYPLASYSQEFSFNKATGKKVSIATPPDPKYPGQVGAFSLVNGIYSHKGLSYPDWLGWVGNDLEATIDLGKNKKIDSVRMHTLNQNGSWIYLPRYVEVLTSADGKDFTSVGKSSTFVNDTLTMGWITVPLQNTSSRYIKLIAKNYGLIPDGQPGGGNKAWLFADEIQVY